MRPRWVLRYLTRLGISMARLSRLLGRRAQYFALKDPDLDPHRTRRGMRGGQAIVDVGPDGVQGHSTLPVPLATGDLRSPEPPRTRDPVPIRPQAQGGGDGLFHGAPEGHALLELQSHVLGHQLGIELRMHDLLDVEVDLLARAHLQLVLQPLDLRALASDDDAGAGGGDGDARAIHRALEINPGDPRVVQLVLDEAPDLHILVQEGRVALGGEPARAPRSGGAQSESDRMRLLPHGLVLVRGPRAGSSRG